MLKLPVGYRFNPTDEELVSHYLYNKVMGKPLSCNKAIVERDLYEDAPWEIFSDSTTADDMRYFFTELKGKHNNNNGGAKPYSALWNGKGNAARSIGKGKGKGKGVWNGKAKDKPILDFYGRTIGYMKQLSHKGSHKGGPKEAGRWIMHEYRLAGHLLEEINHPNALVLCRITKMNGKENHSPHECTPHLPMERSCFPEAVPEVVPCPLPEVLPFNEGEMLGVMNEEMGIMDESTPHLPTKRTEAVEVVPLLEVVPLNEGEMLSVMDEQMGQVGVLMSDIPTPLQSQIGIIEDPPQSQIGIIEDETDHPIELLVIDKSFSFDQVFDGAVHLPTTTSSDSPWHPDSPSPSYHTGGEVETAGSILPSQWTPVEVVHTFEDLMGIQKPQESPIGETNYLKKRRLA